MDKQSQVCQKSSVIHQLDPYIESETGILRVGGRIQAANISQEMKHPIILPKKDHITTLIIRQVHHSLSHAGRHHVLAVLREKYWVINGNTAVRGVLSKCIICKRIHGPPMEQKMADLPPDRVNPAPPFTYSCVDFFGPHIVKERRKEVKCMVFCFPASHHVQFI